MVRTNYKCINNITKTFKNSYYLEEQFPNKAHVKQIQSTQSSKVMRTLIHEF